MNIFWEKYGFLGGVRYFTPIYHYFTPIYHIFSKKKTGEMALKILKEYVAIQNKAIRASLSVIIALKYLLKFSELSKTWIFAPKWQKIDAHFMDHRQLQT